MNLSKFYGIMNDYLIFLGWYRIARIRSKGGEKKNKTNNSKQHKNERFAAKTKAIMLNNLISGRLFVMLNSC